MAPRLAYRVRRPPTPPEPDPALDGSMSFFSNRLRTDLSRNPLTCLLEERRGSGLDTLDLTESNPTHVDLPYPHREIADALARSCPPFYEPHPRGLRSAREAISTWLGHRGLSPNPDQLLITSGTSEAYSFLFKLLLNPGESLLVPRPSYPLLDFIAALDGVRLRSYRLVHDRRWRVDLDSLEEALEDRTRAVVVIHPNNPTGSCLSDEEAAGLLNFCARNSLAVISDEVFLEYPLTETASRVSSLEGTQETLVFCLDGLSKSAGMPQVKLSWIRASGPATLCEEALQRLDLISDTFLSVGTPVQAALPRLLEIGAGVRAALQDRLASNLQWLRHQMRSVPSCSLLEPEAGWNAVLRLPAVRSDEAWALELLRKGVYVQPGYFYDFTEEAILVVSLLPPEELFRKGLSQVLAHAGE